MVRANLFLIYYPPDCNIEHPNFYGTHYRCVLYVYNRTSIPTEDRYVLISNAMIEASYWDLLELAKKRAKKDEEVTPHSIFPAYVYDIPESKIETSVDKSLENDFVIREYDKHNPIQGQDLVYTKEPGKLIAVQRPNQQKVEWYSFTSDINRDSYLGLTQQLDQTGNASKIANLFADYVKKGRGLSSLLHLHLFRHKANLLQAEIIARELSSDEFRGKSNLEIADYLASKYEALEPSINANGSFARRTNYAILQLTQGLCCNAAEFRLFQAYQPNPEEDLRAAKMMSG